MHFNRLLSPDDGGSGGGEGAAPGALPADLPGAGLSIDDLADDPAILKRIIKTKEDAIRKDGNRRSADAAKISELSAMIEQLKTQKVEPVADQTQQPAANESGTQTQQTQQPATVVAPDVAAELEQLRAYKASKDAEDVARREQLKTLFAEEDWNAIGADSLPTLAIENIAKRFAKQATTTTGGQPSVGQERVLSKDGQAEQPLTLREAAKKRLMGS